MLENIKHKSAPKEIVNALLTLYHQGKFDDVLLRSSQLIKEYPQTFVLHNIMGAISFEKDQKEVAIEHFRKVIELRPNHPYAYNNLGASLIDISEYKEAKSNLKKAIDLQPDYAEAYNNLGNVYIQTEEYKQAIAVYKNAIELNPQYYEAYNNLGVALGKNEQYEEAEKVLRKVIKLNPEFIEPLNNLGSILTCMEKFEEAKVILTKSIKINSSNSEALSNLGDVHRKLNEYEQAIDFYKQAIKINPNYYEAFNKNGMVLQDQGKLEDAISSYKQALFLKPEFTDAYNNIGITLKELGNFKEALEFFNKALSLKPDSVELYNNIGTIFLEQDNLEKALNAFKKAFLLNPRFIRTQMNIGINLQNFEFKNKDKIMKKIIISLLNQGTLISSKQISKAIISMIKLEVNLSELSNFLLHNNDIISLVETILKISECDLLLKFMSLSTIPDLKLENLLSKLRTRVLLSIKKLKNSNKILRFQSALALQSFTNEYIYLENEKEINAIKELEILVSSTLENGKQPSPNAILCLASYKSLIQYNSIDKLIITEDIEEVYNRQFIEPSNENRQKSSIPFLGKITNNLSLKVMEQYESNPYPRWVDIGLFKPRPILKVLSGIKLNLFDDLILQVESPDILVAGCGTGQQSINTGSRFKNCKILAIDLSMSSLAYAKRKTEDLQLSNIEYIQADILDLGKLEKKFHIIECVGVLHHMDHPLNGWKVLKNCLKKGGLMKIGLYSELARQIILKIRDEIYKKNIGTSDIEMKSLRNNIINSNEEKYVTIKQSSDFYSMSELRDLIFHTKEHRFTIPQIQKILLDLGLEFCGFESSIFTKKFEQIYGSHNLYNLKEWDDYERKNPSIFSGMYQFWCQKI